MSEPVATPTPRTGSDAKTGAPLVTGGTGFAGKHLVALLSTSDTPPAAPASAELDLCDGAAALAFVHAQQPAAVFHLAAFSSPSRSWDRPDAVVLNNVRMTINLLEAVRREAPGATLVLVGSGQVYGEPADLPTSENAPLAPGNPYAVSKATADLLGGQYAEAFGLRIVRLRPFNHAGPGQSDEYVVSDLARQVAEAEAAGAKELVLRTGDPASARDFTDVRDVARAYRLAATLDGGVFNVCSGRSVSVSDLVRMVTEHARIPIRHEVDPGRLREHDARVMCGSHAELTEATGWKPEIPIEQTVADTLDWWRSRLSR